jgi:hypothetical protein
LSLSSLIGVEEGAGSGSGFTGLLTLDGEAFTPLERGLRDGDEKLAAIERVRRLVAGGSSDFWLNEALRFGGISVRVRADAADG